MKIYSIDRVASFFICVVLAVIVSYISSQRVDFGTDTVNYLSFYENLGVSNYNLIFEPGFILFATILKWANVSAVGFLFFCTFFSLIFMFLGIVKLTPNVFYCFIIFILTYSLSFYFGQIRQGLALSIFIYGCAFLLCDRNYKVSLALFVLSILFHYSAFIAVVLVLLKNFFSVKRLFYVSLISILFIFVDTSWVLELFLSFIPIFDFVFNKLQNYSNNMEIQKVGFSFIHLVYIFNICFFYYYSLKLKANVYSSLCKLYLLGVSLNFFFNSFPYLIRSTYYLLVFEFVMVSLIIAFSRYRTNSVIFFVVYFLLAMMRFTVTYTSLSR